MNNLKNERGIAMLTVIGVLLILSILTVGVFTLTNQNLKASTYWRQKDNSLYMAESGINYLLYELRNRPPELYNFPYILSSSSLTGGILEEGDSFRVVFDQQSVTGNIYQAESTGTSTNTSRVINILMEFINTSLFPQEYVKLSATTPEDVGYYKDYMKYNYVSIAVKTVPAGSYPTLALRQGDTQTISGTNIWYENVTINNNGTLNIVAPAIINIEGNLNIEGGNLNIILGNQPDQTVQILIGGNLIMSQNHPSINVGTTTTIHVNGSVGINNLSKVDATAAQALIYVKGGLSLENNTLNNNMNYPAENLVFLLETSAGLNGNVTLGNNTYIIAGIYAPTRIVSMNNSTTIKGAVVGESFTTNGTEGRIYYWDRIEWDRSLLYFTLGRDFIWLLSQWTD